MSPTIDPGSYLLFHHFIYRRLLTQGKIIKVQHPIYGSIVKKIMRIDQQGSYWLEGVNTNSVSSKQMGAIDLHNITGIVVYQIKSSARSHQP